MTGATAQLWVAGIGVALALGYTVWAAVRKFRGVQAGGSACGGCSGDACGSGGSGGCAPGAAGVAQPLRWQPPARRHGASPGHSDAGVAETN
jgi:hypothetical protein